MALHFLICHEPIQLWSQGIRPIATGDFNWAKAITFTDVLWNKQPKKGALYSMGKPCAAGFDTL